MKLSNVFSISSVFLLQGAVTYVQGFGCKDNSDVPNWPISGCVKMVGMKKELAEGQSPYALLAKSAPHYCNLIIIFQPRSNSCPLDRCGVHLRLRFRPESLHHGGMLCPR
ncbi:hypothetical protein PGTUg99_007487 [Puccinia graminis f. sp. tritici]|uniref:Uncharacterized protein n=1 Tax=Puccinia graminis f. sp. tritici TaxID=56615 RepID=A0A5B0M270_PUCGR|nr:hypothetical protein PGTUg99_007487 [Puccinia graminis f. sp. tritici]